MNERMVANIAIIVKMFKVTIPDFVTLKPILEFTLDSILR